MKLKHTLRTEDRENISLEHYKNGKENVIIIAHGFFNSKKNKLFRLIANEVTPDYDVIMFDFRGHGDSSGKFTWTAREPKDLMAVLEYAKHEGYRHIGLMGFSLGAAIALIVASHCRDIKSMVLISTPMSLFGIEYHFWEPEMLSDLKSNFKCNWYGKGARCGSVFYKKQRPIDCAGHIKDTSIFFIHGDRDWVIKHRHSKALYDMLKGKKKIEVIKKGMHAERLFEQHPLKMKGLILSWFAETLKNGGAK